MIECKHLRKKQIMLEIILCVLLKVLLLTNATVTFLPNDTTLSNFQEQQFHVFYTGKEFIYLIKKK